MEIKIIEQPNGLYKLEQESKLLCLWATIDNDMDYQQASHWKQQLELAYDIGVDETKSRQHIIEKLGK